MVDKDEYISGDDAFSAFRHIEENALLPADVREEFGNTLDEMEWVIEENPDAPESMLQERAETWEENMNTVLSQIEGMGQLDIYFDDEDDLIIDRREE